MTQEEIKKIKAVEKLFGVSLKKETKREKDQTYWLITEKPEVGGGFTYKMVNYPILMKAKNREEFLTVFCERAKPRLEALLKQKLSSIEAEGLIRKITRVEPYLTKQERESRKRASKRSYRDELFS